MHISTESSPAVASSVSHRAVVSSSPAIYSVICLRIMWNYSWLIQISLFLGMYYNTCDLASRNVLDSHLTWVYNCIIGHDLLEILVIKVYTMSNLVNEANSGIVLTKSQRFSRFSTSSLHDFVVQWLSHPVLRRRRESRRNRKFMGLYQISYVRFANDAIYFFWCQFLFYFSYKLSNKFYIFVSGMFSNTELLQLMASYHRKWT